MYKIISMVLLLFLLNGCCRYFCTTEDQEVSKKCCPVRSVLAKNYNVDVRASILGNGGGVKYISKGPEVTSEHAVRIIEEDSICRAWVAGAIDAKDYAEYLLKSSAASLITTASSGDTETMNLALAQFKDTIGKMQLPVGESIDSYVKDISILAQKYALMQPSEVTKDLNAAYKVFEPAKVTTNIHNESYYVALASKIDYIDKKIDEIKVDDMQTDNNYMILNTRIELIEKKLNEMQTESIQHNKYSVELKEGYEKSNNKLDESIKSRLDIFAEKLKSIESYMVNAYSGRSRPLFRFDGDRHSDLMATSIPAGSRPLFRSNPTGCL